MLKNFISYFNNLEYVININIYQKPTQIPAKYSEVIVWPLVKRFVLPDLLTCLTQVDQLTLDLYLTRWQLLAWPTSTVIHCTRRAG